jgi:hypothetical protein
MREVDELDDPVDERVTEGDERDERAVRDADDDRGQEELDLSAPPYNERGGPCWTRLVRSIRAMVAAT